MRIPSGIDNSMAVEVVSALISSCSRKSLIQLTLSVRFSHLVVKYFRTSRLNAENSTISLRPKSSLLQMSLAKLLLLPATQYTKNSLSSSDIADRLSPVTESRQLLELSRKV